MDRLAKLKQPKYLAICAAALACIALIVGVAVSRINRHPFTVYAEGDYISQALIDQFTEETGIKVNYVTGGRTPEAAQETLFADQSAEGVETAVNQALTEDLAEDAAETLIQQLQAPRDATIAKAREKAEQKGDVSSFDPEALEFPAAEYDVVLTDGATLGALREQGLLLPLTYAKVSNLKNISDDYRSLPYDPDREYTITTMWEYVGLLADMNLVQEQLTSWDVLWDQKYAGQIVMPDHMHDALAVTLLAMGKDPSSTDAGLLDEALTKLEQQVPLVNRYSNRDAFLLMQNDMGALYPCWSGDALTMMSENPGLIFLLPPGGTYRTTFGYAVPADSRRTEEAMTFINFMCSAENLARNAVYSKYASTSNMAIDKLDESWSENPVIYPDPSVLADTPVLMPLSPEVEQSCAERWNTLIGLGAQDTADQQGDASTSAAQSAQVSPEPAAAASAAPAEDKDTEAEKKDDKKDSEAGKKDDKKDTKAGKKDDKKDTKAAKADSSEKKDTGKTADAKE